ncbi:MAG: tetratricopeptide repeat protein [Bdellovibrionales bacterium]|nr:tetratricopeptide repeat protein [Bdellovibrionales bacterium]
MKNYIFILVPILFLSFGCSTQLKIITQPEKATVWVINAESGEKKKLGVTPIEKKNDEIKEAFDSFGKPGEFVTLSIEKEDYITRNIWLPLSASGLIESEINVRLKKDDKKIEELKSAKEILDKMFLAQSFARSKQFERALIEIDKVVENYPEFARALSMKASIYYAKGDFKESLEWFEKALEIEPALIHAVEMAASVRKRLRLPASLPAKKKAPEVK